MLDGDLLNLNNEVRGLFTNYFAGCKYIACFSTDNEDHWWLYIVQLKMEGSILVYTSIPEVEIDDKIISIVNREAGIIKKFLFWRFNCNKRFRCYNVEFVKSIPRHRCSQDSGLFALRYLVLVVLGRQFEVADLAHKVDMKIDRYLLMHNILYDPYNTIPSSTFMLS